MSYKFKFSLS